MRDKEWCVMTVMDDRPGRGSVYRSRCGGGTNYNGDVATLLPDCTFMAKLWVQRVYSIVNPIPNSPTWSPLRSGFSYLGFQAFKMLTEIMKLFLYEIQNKYKHSNQEYELATFSSNRAQILKENNVVTPHTKQRVVSIINKTLANHVLRGACI